MKTAPSPAPRIRPGFTLVELLTVIAIVGILAAIIIPVVGKVRQSAHRATCGSNLRQVGIALNSYVAENKGGLPGYDPITDKDGTFYGLNRAAGPRWWTEGGRPTRDLAAHLRPYFSMEHQGGANTGIITLLICPSHPSANQTDPGTSYYISTGVRTNTGVIRRPIAYGGVRALKFADIASPPKAVALFDFDAELLPVIGQTAVSGTQPTSPHGETRNVLYFDGHVGSVPRGVNPHETL